MKAHDREVAGIRCTEVLQDLSAYFDGELPPEQVVRIEAHLRGCDWCERFGSDFTRAITGLRDELSQPDDSHPELHQRLMDRLRRVAE